MAGSERESHLGQWRKRAQKIAEKQESNIKSLLREGYELFFDSVGSIESLPKSSSPLPLRPFESGIESNIPFIHFSGADERLNEFKEYFMWTDRWQVGMSGFRDWTEENSAGMLRCRSIQVTVQPVNQMLSRRTYKVQFNKFEGNMEAIVGEQKTYRELNVSELESTKFVNGYKKDDGFPSITWTEFDHIRFLNCLAHIYTAGFENPNLAPETVVDSSKLSAS